MNCLESHLILSHKTQYCRFVSSGNNVIHLTYFLQSIVQDFFLKQIHKLSMKKMPIGHCSEIQFKWHFVWPAQKDYEYQFCYFKTYIITSFFVERRHHDGSVLWRVQVVIHTEHVDAFDIGWVGLSPAPALPLNIISEKKIIIIHNYIQQSIVQKNRSSPPMVELNTSDVILNVTYDDLNLFLMTFISSR